MESVTILCVGRLKERFFSDAAAEYVKRLGRFCKLQIIEVKDEPTPDRPSEKERTAVLEKEGARILEKLPRQAYAVALCVEGKQLQSEAFAEMLGRIFTTGKNHVVFVIGGSMGLSDAVKERADLRLGFSEMTFPHQLMRVILLEQVYRAYCIRAGSPYHK